MVPIHSFDTDWLQSWILDFNAHGLLFKRSGIKGLHIYLKTTRLERIWVSKLSAPQLPLF